jgi:hypothetical protein
VAVRVSVDYGGGRRIPDVPASRDELGVLAEFREAWHGCLTRRADALFELTDALLCAPGPVSSVPSLSLEPTFRRGHGSLYAALACGQVDAEAARDLLVANRPADWPLVFAVDTSSWPRCDAECSPQRGLYYHPSRHSAGQPIVAGWSYAWIAQLSWDKDSWTAPLDSVRVPPGDDTGRAAAEQLTALVGRLGATEQAPLFVHDAGYDPVGLTVDLDGVRAQVLVRIRSDRVLYTDPPERAPGAIGRPRRHGRRFACDDPATWGDPDDRLSVKDDQYGHIQVTAWRRLHPKLAHRGRWRHHPGPLPIVRGTIIRVQVQHLPKHDTRAVKTLWLWHAGAADANLDACWRAYIRRFDIEHTLRFGKHTLGWVTPRVRHPAQADRWTWLVLAASTQLRLARGVVADQRLPWEQPRPARWLSPLRVRRGFPRLACALGSPASAPKPCGRSPGRPKGRRSGPAPRHPAIKKTA